MFREHLAILINKDHDMAICGEADNIRDAMNAIERTKPDIVILDIGLRGGSSGLELIKNIKAQELRLPVLVLSMHDEELYAERVLRAGAQGYITKHEASSVVVQAIRQVLSGGIYASENVTRRMLQKMSKGQAPDGPSGIKLLTDRELEVFQWIGQGRNTREISIALNLGETTVETYRTRIKDKLGLRNAAELTQRAVLWVAEQ